MIEFLRRRRRELTASLAIPLLVYLSTWGYVVTGGNYDNKKRSDAIVVLNTFAGQTLGDPNPCQVARIRHGVELLQEGWAKNLILMSEKSARLAEKYGANPKYILNGVNPTHTDGEAIETKKILAANRLETVIIVTEPYQNQRAADIFSSYGISATVSPTGKTPCTEGRIGSNNYGRDTVALLWFQILKRTGGRYPTGSWTQQSY